MTTQTNTSNTPAAGAVTWLRKNLFRSVGDSILTVVATGLAAYLAVRLVRFAFFTGRWEVVKVNLSLFLTGVWPEDQLWRITAAVLVFAFVAGIVAGAIAKNQRQADPELEIPTLGGYLIDLASRIWPVAIVVLLMLLMATTPGPWLLTIGVIGAFIVGRFLGPHLPVTGAVVLGSFVVLVGLAMVWLLMAGRELDSWGGLMLNLFWAALSITLCFPIGVLMALGRRSSFPIVRGLSTAYIELFRGVPLIALLLMANIALGFFIPASLAPGSVVRAIVIFVLFTGAYVAEIVRGGLQSVPRGQFEAGRALGLSPIAVTRRIVLPQALRNVIPSLVGQFISLLKDTTLAGAAMGIIDLLAGAEAVTAQDAFRGQGLIPETTIFVMLLFWAASYTMSNESQRLETRLGVGQR